MSHSAGATRVPSIFKLPSPPARACSLLPPPPDAATTRHPPASHGGDLSAIFAQLGEDPKKALKYPPADRSVFARKVCPPLPRALGVGVCASLASSRLPCGAKAPLGTNLLAPFLLS